MSQVNGSEEALVRTQECSVHYFQRPDAGYLTLDSTRTSLAGYGGNLQMGKQSGRFQFMAFLSYNSPGLELNDLGFLASTEEILQIFWMSYRFNESFWIIRNAQLNFNQYSCWDFGGNHQVSGFNVNGHATFKNLWQGMFLASASSETLSNTALRGGPSMVLPGSFSSSLALSTSSRNKVQAEVEGFCFWGFENYGDSYELALELSYKPVSNLTLSLYPGLEYRQRILQYVTQEHFDTDDRYVFGSIEQKTFSLSLRVDLILSPELTIQFWGQPFIASRDYFDYKYITNSKAENFTDRFHPYEPGEIAYSEVDNMYWVSESGSGINYEFENPDFNIREFLSNLVFRWEYRPGSFVYLVWSQSRSGHDLHEHFQFSNDFSGIWDLHPTDVLLLKVSYRIGR